MFHEALVYKNDFQSNISRGRMHLKVWCQKRIKSHFPPPNREGMRIPHIKISIATASRPCSPLAMVLHWTTIQGFGSLTSKIRSFVCTQHTSIYAQPLLLPSTSCAADRAQNDKMATVWRLHNNAWGLHKKQALWAFGGPKSKSGNYRSRTSNHLFLYSGGRLRITVSDRIRCRNMSDNGSTVSMVEMVSTVSIDCS